MDLPRELQERLERHGLTDPTVMRDLWRYALESAEKAPAQSRGNPIVSDQSASLQQLPFVPGRTLRFTPQYAKIRVDPSKGWNFSGPSPPDPPLPPYLSKAAPLKVGMITDGNPALQRMISTSAPRSGTSNEGVYLHLCPIAMVAFELRDYSGEIVQNKYVRFDAEYNSEPALINAAVKLRAAELKTNNQNWLTYLSELQQWRIAHRNWEITVLKNEFNAGNLAIFPPDITKSKIRSAVKLLRERNAQERPIPLSRGPMGQPVPPTQAAGPRPHPQ